MASSKKYPDWFTSEVRRAVKIALAQGEQKDWFRETALKGAASDDFSFLTDEKLDSAKELAETGETDLDSVSMDDFATQIKTYLGNTAKTLNVKPATSATSVPEVIKAGPETLVIGDEASEAEEPVAQTPVAQAPIAGASQDSPKSLFERSYDFNTVAIAVGVAAVVGYILGSL